MSASIWGLDKTFKITEQQQLRFELGGSFNVFNNVRF